MALTLLDGALLLMVLIWGSNFSVVKVALRDFPEIPFNAMRLLVGSAVFMGAMWWNRESERQQARLTRTDWLQLMFLGAVGTFLYQLCFVAAVQRTSVANGSLIIGISPIVISLLSALAGHERIKPVRWVGVFLALAGLYMIVGHGAELSAETLLGDALMIGGVLCWAIYSVASQPILRRHSALTVIALTFSMGGALYVVAMIPILVQVDWAAISWQSWGLMLASALLALNLSYFIWYTGLQKLGGSRTSVYSYLTPIVAMIVAAIWLGEPVSANQLAGAGAVFAGLLITRFVN
ncbi:MAG: DMT family transporter [Gammaproteobacteria bacterium]|nr:DMT family transporter [Gammaproteobacteria bacterium]